MFYNTQHNNSSAQVNTSYQIHSLDGNIYIGGNNTLQSRDASKSQGNLLNQSKNTINQETDMESINLQAAHFNRTSSVHNLDNQIVLNQFNPKLNTLTA